MKTPPNLKTRRLILRAFRLADAPVVQKLAGVFEIADTTLNIPHPYPEGAAIEWITSHPEQFNRRKEIHFAITLRETQKLIGAISLMNIKKDHSRAEMGYWIAKEHWNWGYATEAAEAMVNFGFNELNLHKIYATYFRRNPASGKVLEKIGMHQEGVLRSHIQKWGRYEDLVICGLIKEKNQKSEN